MSESTETTSNTLELQPYRFEPINRNYNDELDSDSEASLSDNEGEPDVNTERIGNTDWCKCGYCQTMDTGRESVCCQENDRVFDRMDTASVECMTLHEGFEGTCLNIHVLEMSLYAYIQDISPIDDNELPHKVYRYIAYRNFTRYIYHRLRKYERKVIPSCCVMKIRNTFPSEEFCGFKYPIP